jgi:hypothetical protein
MAANLLASRMKIDIYGILKNENEARDVREVLRTVPMAASVNMEKRNEKEQTVAIKKNIVDTFGLPPKLANEANRMAEIYPKLYVLENMLRNVVKSVLTESIGENWWTQTNVVSADTKREVERRKALEGENRWHYQRGSHEIFYTNFGDLNLIVANNWKEFKPLFPSLRWIQAKLEEIELSRNIVAHNNPLPKREFDRIDMIFGDLEKQLDTYISKQRIE